MPLCCRIGQLLLTCANKGMPVKVYRHKDNAKCSQLQQKKFIVLIPGHRCTLWSCQVRMWSGDQRVRWQLEGWPCWPRTWPCRWPPWTGSFSRWCWGSTCWLNSSWRSWRCHLSGERLWFEKGPFPKSFFIYFLAILHNKNCWLHRDSNLDRQSRRWAHLPLYHNHHGPRNATQLSDENK